MISADYFVRTVELPAAVRGVTVPNDDGTFSIYINALYSDESRRKTLEHELSHLAREHFYKDEPIEAQEAEADGRTLPEKEPPPAQPVMRCYRSPKALEEYLASIGALGTAMEDLSEN